MLQGLLRRESSSGHYKNGGRTQQHNNDDKPKLLDSYRWFEDHGFRTISGVFDEIGKSALNPQFHTVNLHLRYRDGTLFTCNRSFQRPQICKVLATLWPVPKSLNSSEFPPPPTLQNRRYARASRFASPPVGSAGSHHRRSNLQTPGFQMPKLGTTPVEHHSSSSKSSRRHLCCLRLAQAETS